MTEQNEQPTPAPEAEAKYRVETCYPEYSAMPDNEKADFVEDLHAAFHVVIEELEEERLELFKTQVQLAKDRTQNKKAKVNLSGVVRAHSYAWDSFVTLGKYKKSRWKPETVTFLVEDLLIVADNVRVVMATVTESAEKIRVESGETTGA